MVTPIVFDPDTRSYFLQSETIDSIRMSLAKQIASDREAKLAKALMEFGWMSPDQVAQVRQALAAAHEAAVRKGVAVHWDILEEVLRTAHDALPTPTR